MRDDYPARMEQGKMGARDMGRLMAAFHDQLIEEGVPERNAGEITAAYCRSTVSNLKKKED